MKKLIAALALVIFTASCTPAETTPMQGGIMCEKCSCCQKMMGDATMKDKMMSGKKSGGEQCMIGKGGKDGKSCCCKKMMGGDKMENMLTSPATEDHSGHHPTK